MELGEPLGRLSNYIPLFVLMFWVLQSGSAGATSLCSVFVNASNQSYSMPGASCGQVAITFEQGVSNSGVACNAQAIGSGSTLLSRGDNFGVYIRNCTLEDPRIVLANHTSLYIIGSDNATFVPVLNGSSSNITVAHYLRVNVFEPFGYNTLDFGDRAAGFSYIFPLMNNTLSFRNDELVMNEFLNSTFNETFAALRGGIPFGAYNMTQSNILSNYTVASYGNIKGSKVFVLPDYTLSKNKLVRYNPYEVDYSFLAYDQLVMFRLNITKNTNLTPMYIQPLFPPFNFAILPDNGTHAIEIKYIVAIPPQDANWNFTGYLYRYAPNEFITNPVSGIVGAHSALFKAFSLPGSPANETANGTRFYFIDYPANLSLGINSSIMTTQGYIPGLGSFIQDSTTPSFGFGLGYCALAHDLTVPMGEITVSRPGTYNMVKRLLPVAEPALPELVDSSCTTGVVISGNNIEINCNNGTINDTVVGLVIRNSNNVNINNCNIVGNGLEINDSSGISLYNTTLTPSQKNNFGIRIKDVLGVSFFGLRVRNGYSDIFSVFSSVGTPFSQAIQVYNLTICGGNNASQIRHFAYIYGLNDTCSSGVLTKIESGIDSWVGLAILTIALAIFYLYAFLRTGRKRERRGNARKKRRA